MIISRKKGPFLGDTWIAHDSPKILENYGQSITIWGALFRTLIAAKNAPFSELLRSPSRGADFYPISGQSAAAISSQKLGHFGDTWIDHDFPKILGKARAIYHHLGRPYFEP